MSFLFRKNGNNSKRRIKEKILGRNSDRGRKEEERVRYDDSTPPPPSPWGFLFPEDFVRIDGNLKAVIVDEQGLDVIYWKKLIELENSGKIKKNTKPRRRRKGGLVRTEVDDDDQEGEEYDDDVGERGQGSGDDYHKGENTLVDDAFSFNTKKSKSPLSSTGAANNNNNNSVVIEGERYYNDNSSSSNVSAASSSALPSSSIGVVGGDYGGKPSQSKFQAPGGGGGGSGSFPSSPSHFTQIQTTGGGGGRSPLPLPPGQFTAAIPSSSTSTLGPPYTGVTPPTYTGVPPQPPSSGAPPPPPFSGAPPPPPPPLAGGPPPPPIPAKKPPGPPPPPPGKKAPGPPPPPPGKKAPGPPKPPGNTKGPTKIAETSSAIEKTEDPDKPKLKPLHWDKVNPDAGRSMVWNRMEGGSFSFDGDLMEALFGYVGARKPNETTNNAPPKPTVSISKTYILDPRQSQNKAIVLKSLGMTKEEIIDLLTEGHEVDSDTLEKLSRIAPTQEEQTKIIAFNSDPTKLADAESLLFHILKVVPSAFNRLNVMLFKINYGSEVTQQKGSLHTLEAACTELRARGLFMKLLEAILKAGNRMNAGTARGNAQAFNLTALRKLSDVKSVDGKTTLLHFVVEEVVRSEGKRAAMNKTDGEIAEKSREEQEVDFVKLGLPIIGGLSSEFTNVKKAAGIDYDSFVATTLALGNRVKETKRLLDQSKGKEDECLTKLRSFFISAEEELKVITEEQLRIIELVKKTTNYYQAGALKERNLFQLFVIIRDFLGMVDNACSEIARNQRKLKPVTTVVAGASSSTSGAVSAVVTPSSPAAAPQRNAVRFPILPPNFMSSAHSRNSSSDSDSDS